MRFLDCLEMTASLPPQIKTLSLPARPFFPGSVCRRALPFFFFVAEKKFSLSGRWGSLSFDSCFEESSLFFPRYPSVSPSGVMRGFLAPVRRLSRRLQNEGPFPLRNDPPYPPKLFVVFFFFSSVDYG